MSVIATALKHLMAAGVTGDALIEAIAEIEAALPGAQPAEPTRSKAAIRQERYRRNKASQNVTNGVTNVTDHNENVTSNAERNGDPLPLPPNDNNSNPPTPTPENITPREAEDAHVAAWLAWWDRDPFPRPDWASARLWADFRKNRKTKRLTNTFTAYAQQLAKIRELSRRTGWPPGEVLEDCVARGWGAVFETDKMKAAINGHGTGNRQQSPRHHGGRDNRDGFKRACDDWIDEAERSAVGGNGAGGQLALGGPDAL